MTDLDLLAQKLAFIARASRGRPPRVRHYRQLAGVQADRWRLALMDETNAARTMLFNIHTRAWDEELLKLFRVPRAMLPEVQASLFGHMRTSPGLIKSTYGTGCFVLANTGDQIVRSQNRLLSLSAVP